MAKFYFYLFGLLAFAAILIQAKENITLTGRLACTSKRLCSNDDRLLWLKRREYAHKIAEFAEEHRDLDMYSSQYLTRLYYRLFDANKEPLLRPDVDPREWRKLKVLEVKEDLCHDKHTSGFMFEKDTDIENWPMACLWTGSDINGTCAPAPPTDLKFDFMSANEWRGRVSSFRRALGCSFNQTSLINQVSELYICRGHCTQGGLGYMFAIFIMFSMLVVVGALCF